MKVLLLGVGMQGKAALHDLASSDVVTEVVAADADLDGLKTYVTDRGDAHVTCEHVDADDAASVARLMSTGVAVVVCLLPPRCAPAVARAAVSAGVHFVETSYASPALTTLADAAAAADVALLPEFGLDPGIDLVMLGEAIRRLDVVEEMRSYGSGIPEPAAADNPLRYKVSWRLDGVLSAYRRPARVMRDGVVIDVDDRSQFRPEHVHTIEVEGLGTLEAYPNGDAMRYARFLGDTSALRHAGRYAGRWPGHAAFWKKLVDLHFLDEDPIDVDGARVSPRRFLSALLGPQLQYAEDELDMVHVRVDLVGRKNGERKRLVFEMIDRRDLATGFTAMSRTVGFTAAIGAQMLLTGAIAGRGLLSPVCDVPWKPFKSELAKRGIRVTEIGDSP